MALTKTQEAILAVVDKDARLSHAEVSKQCKIPKSVVTYNLNQLVKSVIIKGFATLVDHSSLGYLELRVYLNLYESNMEKEKQFIEHLTSMNNTSIVVLCVGDFDLIVNFYVKDIHEFWKQWFELLKSYRSIVKDYAFNIIVEKNLFPFFPGIQNRIQKTYTIGNRKPAEVDKIDRKLLDLLNNDCRRPLFEIANILEMSSSSVIYRIKKLEEKKVILGYYTIFNFEKLKKEFFRIQFQFEEINPLESFINTLKISGKVLGFSKIIGSFNDLEVDVLVDNIEGLISFVNEIRQKFPGFVRDYRYLHIVETHKWNHNPEAND